MDKPKYNLPVSPNKFAIVVGIEKYSDLPISSYSERDATVMRDHLAAMGFAPRNIILLTDEEGHPLRNCKKHRELASQ